MIDNTRAGKPRRIGLLDESMSESEPEFDVGDRVVIKSNDENIEDIPERRIQTITRRFRDIDDNSIVYAVERYPDLEGGPKPDLRSESDLIQNYTVIENE